MLEEYINLLNEESKAKHTAVFDRNGCFIISIPQLEYNLLTQIGSLIAGIVSSSEMLLQNCSSIFSLQEGQTKFLAMYPTKNCIIICTYDNQNYENIIKLKMKKYGNLISEEIHKLNNDNNVDIEELFN
ncbi:MAG: roadblock/LC7 domain-containing protein [Endomicrobia bacterium]|nr:roadblock/LC7 domain-containing protein [Endomicrobiia bacterium]